MKTYIILTGTIFAVGGAQIYTRNKVDYLEKRGWRVLVYSHYIDKSLYVDELAKYKKYIIPELKLPFFTLRIKQLKR